MARTTLSLRIAVPLYGLNGAEFDLGGIVDGLPDVKLMVTLVDSSQPTEVQVRTRGAGSSVTIPGDAVGMFHNTRLDFDLPGAVDAWADSDRLVLANLINRVIDWYRAIAGHVTVRRVPFHHLTGYQARDTDGRSLLLMVPIGASPGDAAENAGLPNADLVARMQERVPRPLPLWVSLYLDARAEAIADELPVAILLANSSMETLVNRAFRAVAPPDEVATTFASSPATPFWQLLKRVRAILQLPISNTKILRLAGRVHRYRDDVSHGNPVALSADVVEDALDALKDLGALVDPAVVRFLRAGGL